MLTPLYRTTKQDEHIQQLGMYVAKGSEQTHPKVLRDLADVIMKPLCQL